MLLPGLWGCGHRADSGKLWDKKYSETGEQTLAGAPYRPMWSLIPTRDEFRAESEPGLTELHPSTARVSPSEHVVRSGETLSSIADKYYGDRSKWDDIYEANQGHLKSPDAIQVGMHLVIPGF